MAWRHRRSAGVNVGIDDPFLYHQRPAVMSVWGSVVRSYMSKQSAIHVWWIMLPVRSR